MLYNRFMIKPPDNLILEIPFSDHDICPVNCRHCIHYEVIRSPFPRLSHQNILAAIVQGKNLGVKWLNIYPHRGDVSLFNQKTEFIDFLLFARSNGLNVKSLTSGINPFGVEALLPYLDRLSISVDALDWETYSIFRSKNNYNGLLRTLDVIKYFKQDHPDFFLNALVLVNRQTLSSIERRIAEILELGIFNKIKILEMLPLGKAGNLYDLSLLEHSMLSRLVKIKKAYASDDVRIGVPLWRIKNGQRGCRLVSKDLVIGPSGELAGCTLLFYLNNLVGNFHLTTLEDAWRNNFQIYREKNKRPISSFCSDCPFYQENLCWGGCLARGIIFGQETEVKRSCGIQSLDEAYRLYESYKTLEKPDAQWVFNSDNMIILEPDAKPSVNHHL